MPCRSLGTHGACTWRSSRCGTWIVDITLNTYDISNLLLMLDFYITASARHLIMFGF
ncbi:hypothetical protein Hanom_Chr02g00120451 [Helianthus anomalus]